MIMAGGGGVFGALAHGGIQSQSRLMGYSPNEISEQKKPLVDPADESAEYLEAYVKRNVPKEE